MDSSSLLAYLRGDPGGHLVQRILRQSAECGYRVKIAPMDLLEVYGQCANEDSVLHEVAALIEQLPCEVTPFTGWDVMQVARIAAERPELGYGQSASLHLARTLGATLVTANEKLKAAWEPSLLIKGEDRKNGETYTNQSTS
ncbi:MAG: PIN domain-containing protein [Bacillota bacterium]|jgi:PIN domain nuclease of toxin-antitoxin system